MHTTLQDWSGQAGDKIWHLPMKYYIVLMERLFQNSVFHAFPDGLDIKSVHFSVHFHNHQTELWLFRIVGTSLGNVPSDTSRPDLPLPSCVPV